MNGGRATGMIPMEENGGRKGSMTQKEEAERGTGEPNTGTNKKMKIRAGMGIGRIKSGKMKIRRKNGTKDGNKMKNKKLDGRSKRGTRTDGKTGARMTGMNGTTARPTRLRTFRKPYVRSYPMERKGRARARNVSSRNSAMVENEK